jgi:hypothetical protein
MLGVDNAGKSTIINDLKGGNVTRIVWLNIYPFEMCKSDPKLTIDIIIVTPYVFYLE